MLWCILQKFGCPPKFLAVLRALHDGARARVTHAGGQSDSFPVAVGVRQGCVLAPVIFNLFLAAVNRIASPLVRTEDCLSVTYRLDGSLFNKRRLQSRTLTSTVDIFDLQYADDASLIGTSDEGLQRSLGSMVQSYTKDGLKINTTKAKIITQLDLSRS